MTEEAQHGVTGLLQAWRHGDRMALEQLTRLVYAELHRLAHFYLAREQPGHTLQTSELVNEVYLRLTDAGQVDWRDRAHFFAVSARIMRRILVQYARLRGARKRAGRMVKLEFSEALLPAPERSADLIAVDDALKALAMADPREAEVVELRFFGGLTEQETAHVLGISDRTVRRDWEHAKVWLFRELKRGAGG